MLLSTIGNICNRIALDRMKTAVEKLLRDHQARFRKDRACPDQIAELRIIVEQSLQLKSSVYINFIDFKKAFDSVDRLPLEIMRHYGIPNKYVSIIKDIYKGMTCRILHRGYMSGGFSVQTGIRQGCLLPFSCPFLLYRLERKHRVSEMAFLDIILSTRWSGHRRWFGSTLKRCRRNKTGVFAKHECPRWKRSPKLAIFSIKVTVKVSMSLILASFERVALVQYACQIWSLYLLWFKSYG